jgi:hypothetical protein
MPVYSTGEILLELNQFIMNFIRLKAQSAILSVHRYEFPLPPIVIEEIKPVIQRCGLHEDEK